MSKLAVGQLEGLASEGYKITVASGSKLMPAGGIVQVVQTVKSDTFSSSSVSFVDVTGMSASITPSSISSKILVLVNANYSASTDIAVTLRLLRGNTVVYVADTAGSRPLGFTTASSMTIGILTPSTGVFLDGPSTTSSVTYKIQMFVNSGTGYLNRTGIDRDTTGYDGRVASSITLLEVAG
jgi:hypothetical protein